MNVQDFKRVLEEAPVKLNVETGEVYKEIPRPCGHPAIIRPGAITDLVLLHGERGLSFLVSGLEASCWCQMEGAP